MERAQDESSSTELYMAGTRPSQNPLFSFSQGGRYLKGAMTIEVTKRQNLLTWMLSRCSGQWQIGLSFAATVAWPNWRWRLDSRQLWQRARGLLTRIRLVTHFFALFSRFTIEFFFSRIFTHDLLQLVLAASSFPHWSLNFLKTVRIFFS